MKGKYIVLAHNGDPYGRGFVGTECEERDSEIGVYRGDIGARSREWWRFFARINGYKLIEGDR